MVRVGEERGGKWFRMDPGEGGFHVKSGDVQN